MGIQDRDYYWEKHKEASKTNNRDSLDSLLNRTPQRYRRNKQSGIRYLFYYLIMLWGFGYGADTLLKHLVAKKNANPPVQSTPTPIFSPTAITEKPDAIEEPISGGVILKTDRQGHFRGTVLINDVPMPFLIDTGATKTSIPANLAYAARLPVGASVNSHTAGGQVVDRLTQISSLKIGNAVIRNLDANINQHLDEVLIGMNTLKYFTITQSGNTMTLVANGSSPEQIVRAPVIAPAPIQPNIIAAEQPATRPEIKRPTTIKKTVTCDARQVCTTKYSDR